MKLSNVYKALAIFSLLVPIVAFGATIGISDLQKEIADLQQEIAQYQEQIKTTQGEAKTLSAAIAELDLSIKKLSADIKLTQKKIELARLNIRKLENEIGERKSDINLEKQAVGELLRSLKSTDDTSVIEVMAGSETLAQFWSDVANLGQLNDHLLRVIGELRRLKQGLEDNKTKTEKEKRNLTALSNRLLDQQRILNQNKLEKQKLLTATRDRESNYSRILQEKIARRVAVEAEINRLESSLKTEIPPGSYPAPQRGLLAWPLDVIRITQYFGNTAFAAANPQIYKGRGHRGVDFAAPIGTPIKAPLSGVVTGTGDTDLACPGASHGQWIVLNHGNGLSTLYAHLSLIKVSQGQSVTTGEIIGYTGNTGASLGPHLHLGLLVTSGVQIITYKSTISGCRPYVMPVASFNSYLNPLSYI